MATKTPNKWQNALIAECRKLKIPDPEFNIVSERRGGRTAWSATVTVQGVNVAARMWYDGQYIENAREDAAEVMLTKLRSPSLTQSQSSQPSSYRHQPGYGSRGGYR